MTNEVFGAAEWAAERDNKVSLRKAQDQLGRLLREYRFRAATPEARAGCRMKIERVQARIDRLTRESSAIVQGKLPKKYVAVPKPRPIAQTVDRDALAARMAWLAAQTQAAKPDLAVEVVRRDHWGKAVGLGNSPTEQKRGDGHVDYDAKIARLARDNDAAWAKAVYEQRPGYAADGRKLDVIRV